MAVGVCTHPCLEGANKNCFLYVYTCKCVTSSLVRLCTWNGVSQIIQEREGLLYNYGHTIEVSRTHMRCAIRFIQAFSILSTKSVLDSEFQQRVLQQQVTFPAAKNGLPCLPNITVAVWYDRGDINAYFRINFFFKIKVEDKWICTGFARIICRSPYTFSLNFTSG